MAAVTINTRKQIVTGSVRQLLLNITIATTGDTLNTGLEAVLFASPQLATNTPSVVAQSGGGTTPVTLTFTTGGAYTGNLLIIGT
jgi:hypothetical protein